MNEIEKNRYNLDISRYMSMIVDEVQIDLNIVNVRLIEINEAISMATKKNNSSFRELWLI